MFIKGKKRVKCVCILLVLLLSICLSHDFIKDLIKRMTIDDIEITLLSNNLYKGSSAEINTIITYTDGRKEIQYNNNYESTDSDIASVTDGKVIAENIGSTKIKTSYYGESTEKEITVVEKLDVSKNSNKNVQKNIINDQDNIADYNEEELSSNSDNQFNNKSGLFNEGNYTRELENENSEVVVKSPFKINQSYIDKYGYTIKVKYSFPQEEEDENNLNVYMMTEDGGFIELKKKIEMNVVDKTISFEIAGAGTYVIESKDNAMSKLITIKAEKTEEESAKEYAKSKDKDLIECNVDGNVSVGKDFIQSHNEVSFKYYVENKDVNENQLLLYRVVEDNKLICVEGQKLDSENKKISAKVADGIYVIKEKNEGDKQSVDQGKNDTKTQIEISTFDIAMSGLMDYSGDKIYKEDVDSLKKNIPEGNGLWVLEKDRQYILAIINRYTKNKYIVDEKGFIKKLEENNINNKGSIIYSDLIDKLVNGDRKIIISAQNNWLFYNKDNHKLEEAKISYGSGISIGSQSSNQIVLLGKEEIDEQGNVINKISEEEIGSVLFHELVHSSKGQCDRGNINEEQYTVEQENLLRQELGYSLRELKEIEQDSVDGDKVVYSYDNDINIGASGPDVVELQQKLMSMGMDLGGYGATGYYGEYTVAAIKAIQEAKGLEVVGRYGTKTRTALNDIYSRVLSSGTYSERTSILSYYNKNVATLTSASTDKDIEIGESGPAVVEMQKKLLQLGFDLGGYGATGYYGTNTVNAIKALQSYKGFNIVGRYGPQTREFVEALIKTVKLDGTYPEKNEIMKKYDIVVSNQELDPGASGNSVIILQNKLLKLGFNLGGYGATGYFGQYTVISLKAIQGYSGLEMLGRYGPSTRDEIEELLSHVDYNGNYSEKSGIMAKYSDLLSNMDLDPGQEGPAVVELQKKLLKLGFDLGGYGATGYFGNYTVAAMKAVQEYYGYETVGRYGPSTRGAILSLYNNMPSSGIYSEKDRLLTLYKKYIKEFAAIDETINVNGKYIGQYICYDQEDPTWASVPFKSGNDNIGNSGCGVSAMAIVQSIMKNRFITPLEMAKYAINNGYCQGYTTRSFFSEVVIQEKYKLNCIRLQKGDIQRVKTLLSDGKHMAVAIMAPSHFTSGGHYIVLSGVMTNNGYNYFEVLDPHKNNPNYTNDGTMIDYVKDDGKVIARTSIFAAECQEYWVYSTINPTNFTPITRAKLNLENLGYSGLRDSSGELIPQWNDGFDKAINLFLKDYNLTNEYNLLKENKTTILFSWIQQAINGQRQPTNPPKGPESETTTNNIDKSDLFVNNKYDVMQAMYYMTSPEYNTAVNENSTNYYNKAMYERFDRPEYSTPSMGNFSGDCANFVAQALVAGGVKMNADFHYKKPKDFYDFSLSTEGLTFVDRDMTGAWAGANEQFKYFSNINNRYTDSAPITFNKNTDLSSFIKDVKVGDLLFWDYDRDGKINHSTMITKIENGVLYYSGHTKNRINCSVKTSIGVEHVLYIIKMNR